MVREIAQSFADAGADILATNTFNANRISQADYGAEALVREINVAAAQDHPRGRRRRAAGRQPRWVAGALGPTNKTLSLSPNVNDPGYREVDFDTLSDVYVEQIEALVEGGVDFVLIETVFDTLNAKAAIHAAKRVEARLGRELPIMLSMTITDLSGPQPVRPFDRGVLGVGPPRPAAVDRPQLLVRRRPASRRMSRRLSAMADTLIMAYPNAGLPNDLGEYDETAEATASQVARWAETGHRQHRRRLLRHYARAYRRHRRDGEGAIRRARFRAANAAPCSPASSR